MRLILSIQGFQIIFVFLFIALSVGCLSSSDLEDAKAAASKVHAQMQSGEYASIYRESASSFKREKDSRGGSSEFLHESQFISKMQEFGTLKKAEIISNEAGIDSDYRKIYTLSSKLEFNGGYYWERLIFARSDSGQMQLIRLEIDPHFNYSVY